MSNFYLRNVNVIKFKKLIMTLKNKSLLIKLCKFMKVINKGVCDPG